MRTLDPSRIRPPASPLFISRAALFVTFVVIALGVACTLAGTGWGELIYRLLIDGALLGAWLIAGYGFGATMLVRVRALHEVPASLRVCVSIALGIGAVGMLVLVLGVVGLLNRTAAAAIIVVGMGLVVWRVGAGLRDVRDVRGSIGSWLRAPARWGWVWVLVAPVAGIVCVAALVPPGVLWGDEPNGYDVVEYHLQVPREWYEAGRIVPLRHNVFSYFPMGMEVHYLLAMQLRGGPWAGMYLAQLMHAAMAGLTVLGIYGIAKQQTEEQQDAAMPHLMGVLVATTPWLGLLAPVAYNECELLLYATLAIGLLTHATDAANSRDATRRGSLGAIAGALAGLSCGAKLTGVPLVLFAPPLAITLAHVGSRSALRRIAIPIIIYLLFGALTASPWLIRTAVWTRGNPIFPESTNFFGKAHWTGEHVERWHQANHLPAVELRSVAGRMSALWRQVIADDRYGYVLLPLAIIAAAISFSSSPPSRVLAILLVLMILEWTCLSHLQSRFLTPIIPVCAMLIAEVRWRGWTAVCAAAAIFSAGWCCFVVGGKLMDVDRRGGGIGRVLGLEDLSPLAGVDLTKLPPNVPVVLVGDARPFLYPIPMARLSYATVFDVVPPSWPVDLTSWRAIDQPATRSSPTAYVVDPNEWRRLFRTYRHVPPPPPPDVAAHTEPFVIVR